MRPLSVVELEIFLESVQCHFDVRVIVQIYLLVLDSAPESFDKDIVQSATSPIHADLNGTTGEALGELDAGELSALVGIEDLGLGTACQCPFQSRNAEAGVQCG